MSKEPDIEDLKAGDAYRAALIPRADATIHNCPLWYGWAIMDAFLAGAEYARRRQPQRDRASVAAALLEKANSLMATLKGQTDYRTDECNAWFREYHDFRRSLVVEPAGAVTDEALKAACRVLENHGWLILTPSHLEEALEAALRAMPAGAVTDKMVGAAFAVIDAAYPASDCNIVRRALEAAIRAMPASGRDAVIEECIAALKVRRNDYKRRSDAAYDRGDHSVAVVLAGTSEEIEGDINILRALKSAPAKSQEGE